MPLDNNNKGVTGAVTTVTGTLGAAVGGVANTGKFVLSLKAPH